VIKVSTAVEDHLLDPLFKTLLGDQFSHFLRRFSISWMFETPFEFGAQCGSTHQGLPCRILNGLGIDVFQAPEDIEARPFNAPFDSTPDPLFPLRSG